MLTIISSIVLSLALAMGLGVTPTQPVSQPANEVMCEEDMPCWDSLTMGVQLPELPAMELDAWDTLGASQITPPTPDIGVEYVESLSYRPASFPAGYFAVESSTQPQTFHIFQWVTLYRS